MLCYSYGHDQLHQQRKFNISVSLVIINIDTIKKQKDKTAVGYLHALQN